MNVFVGVRVMVEVLLGVKVGFGVLVTTAVNVAAGVCADVSIYAAVVFATGVILSGEQNDPVIVQAVFRSSCDSGSGGDGGPTASVPLGPPRGTETCSPAVKTCCCPLASIIPVPLYSPTCISPFLVAFRLALPIRVSSEPFTLK